MSPPVQIRSISVIGLGKLGAPIAASLAARGLDVVGVDVSEAHVELINCGEPPVFEPGLPALMRQAKPRLRATLDTAEAVRATDATLIIVPTPSEADGAFSLRHVLPAAEAIGRALRDKPDYHLVTLTSTVMPGATAGPVCDALERASGKMCGEGFGLCYSPEFVALGSVIRDFLRPDFLLIGQYDERSGDALASIYSRACENDPPTARLNLVNAELTKIAVNTFITTKITYANMLADLCQRLPGGDVEQVTRALGLDKRIGSHYLKGSVGYGGPCFPRDNRALANVADQIGAHAELVRTVDRANDQQTERLLSLVRAHLPVGGTVGVLGLAYKPETDVAERSAGLLLAQALCDEGASVIAYDPQAMGYARRVLDGEPVRYAPDMATCVREADVIVLTTPWSEFDELDASMLQRDATRGRVTVIDCWRRLDPRALGDAVDYVAVGIGPTSTEHGAANPTDAAVAR